MIILVDSQKRGIPWLYTGCFGTGLSAMSQWTSKETLQHQSPVETFPFRNQGKTKIDRLIHIPDDASDRSLFNLPVQATGADDFKLALIHTFEKLDGLNARTVHSRYDEIMV